MGALMEPTGSDQWRDRAHSFLAGDYRGPPIAYLMALAIVFAMIAVRMITILRDLLPEIAASLLTLLTALLA